MLSEETKLQDEKLLSIGADLKSSLDFMVRVNLEQRSKQERRSLGRLPELERLKLSELGQGHLGALPDA